MSDRSWRTIRIRPAEDERPMLPQLLPYAQVRELVICASRSQPGTGLTPL